MIERSGRRTTSASRAGCPRYASRRHMLRNWRKTQAGQGLVGGNISCKYDERGGRERVSGSAYQPRSQGGGTWLAKSIRSSVEHIRGRQFGHKKGML